MSKGVRVFYVVNVRWKREEKQRQRGVVDVIVTD